MQSGYCCKDTKLFIIDPISHEPSCALGPAQLQDGDTALHLGDDGRLKGYTTGVVVREVERVGPPSRRRSNVVRLLGPCLFGPEATPLDFDIVFDLVLG